MRFDRDKFATLLAKLCLLMQVQQLAISIDKKGITKNRHPFKYLNPDAFKQKTYSETQRF